MNESIFPSLNRLIHGWNAFRNKDPASSYQSSGNYSYGSMTYDRPDRHYMSYTSDHTISTAIYNRIALDVSVATLQHCRVDANGQYITEINSGLNEILTVEANIDQSAKQFMVDLVLSMLDEGIVAAVPIDTDLNPETSSFDIRTMRCGKIVGWAPQTVDIEAYNDLTGKREVLRQFPKSKVAIIENPFYSIMNGSNSVMRRLMTKLAMLDAVDEQSSSGKLDLIIQLPYVIKSEARKKEAEKRRTDISDQLQGSKYGIAYIDGTERITQLNRAVDNNLMSQVEYLTSMLYSQLGITQAIMDGTADESTMTNYYKRCIDVILQAICDEYSRKFLTKTARTQGQAIRFSRDPFSLATSTTIADIADKFTRNEILSPNELRSIVGFKPVKDDAANELRNRNINQNGDEMALQPASTDDSIPEGEEPVGSESDGDPYEEIMDAYRRAL